ncbi:TetR/AcrR family transcriptional regulator [Frankia sp. Ag45/Mut15]|uniref:TetR/AcrR family transcriptional regulator n=1 Tax=Frankia umida TaxID=573489 RepID=A0ABT0K297_9ACTN|nr:TetR/AcrR family transcriptional regulator [Frankia umida]MCK9877903.1 TetR/AcrR family transcriptional regulator [Frankia umida]
MTASGPGLRRTQAERRAASEAALLQAAAELIAEVGIERTSLRGVSERAGISRAMPAYHFGSKDGLVDRLVHHAYERTVAATTVALRPSQGDLDQLSRLDLLRAIIETYLTIVGSGASVEERAVIVMWGATFPAGADLPVMVQADQATHRALADTIRDGQQDGSIRADLDADAAALLLMGMARGAAAMSLAHPTAADPARVRDLCGQTITAVLGRP